MCCSFKFQERVVMPTDTATVLAPGGALALSFGFRLAAGRLVVNARAETVLEKPLFRKLVLAGRVVVPAQSFYEWDRQKVRHAFSRFDGRELMLAGICNGRSFVIMTTAANAGMAPVHDRMPLVLEDAGAWLAEGEGFLDLLHARPLELRDHASVKAKSLLDL